MTRPQNLNSEITIGPLDMIAGDRFAYLGWPGAHLARLAEQERPLWRVHLDLLRQDLQRMTLGPTPWRDPDNPPSAFDALRDTLALIEHAMTCVEVFCEGLDG